jgi:hypothetical protein
MTNSIARGISVHPAPEEREPDQTDDCDASSAEQPWGRARVGVLDAESRLLALSGCGCGLWGLTWRGSATRRSARGRLPGCTRRARRAGRWCLIRVARRMRSARLVPAGALRRHRAAGNSAARPLVWRHRATGIRAARSLPWGQGPTGIRAARSLTGRNGSTRLVATRPGLGGCGRGGDPGQLTGAHRDHDEDDRPEEQT